MKKLTKQGGASLDIVGENIKTLKTIFPDVFTEDKVNFDVLRQLLGDAVDEGEEKYGLNWHGKKKARQIALTPSTGTLRPCPEESVDWDTTQNLFIEGDNLEVLKLLQKSYAGKVKMIYIDPPYNTGKEFIYPDKFQDNLDTYLRYTGQKGEEGLKTSSNTESSGRYHTNWLNMMYPRLRLARNLLQHDGVIVISIDDTEVGNIRKLNDEIFGEENFIASVIWQKRTSPDSRANLSAGHDYLLFYCRSVEDARQTLNKLPLKESRKAAYKNPDNDPRGAWSSENLTGQTGHATASQFYKIETPSGISYAPPKGRCWALAEKTFLELKADDRIWFGVNGNNRPRLKRFLSESDGMMAWTWWPNKEVGHNQEATKEVKELFVAGDIFNNPKPIRLINRVVNLTTGKDDLILDFFAGSCTTAHSTIDVNKLDRSSRKFIMVQLPEPCAEKSEAFKAGYKTIADIGKERIRRAAAKIKEELTTKDTKNTKDKKEIFRDFRDFRGSKIDLGFKVFKLDSSNIRAWNPDRNDLEGTLYEHTEHLIPGRTEEDILYELLLKRGVDLTVPIKIREITTKGTKNTNDKKENFRDFRDFRGSKKVFSIGYGVLFACLDTTISRDEVEELALGIAAWHKELEPASDTQVVFRDSAFADDVAKTNMTAILEQNGIKHIRSL